MFARERLAAKIDLPEARIQVPRQCVVSCSVVHIICLEKARDRRASKKYCLIVQKIQVQSANYILCMCMHIVVVCV